MLFRTASSRAEPGGPQVELDASQPASQLAPRPAVRQARPPAGGPPGKAKKLPEDQGTSRDRGVPAQPPGATLLRWRPMRRCRREARDELDPADDRLPASGDDPAGDAVGVRVRGLPGGR